jgi:light-regulated signal transduction histidine kinase (bacteriophytochrome)
MPSPKPTRSSVPRTESELSEFLLRACHDLRGPLRAVRTYSELLLKESARPGADLGAMLAFVANGSVQAGLLVDGLTEYSLALQTDPGSFQPVPMEVVLRATVAKIDSSLREGKAEVTYERLPRVHGSADRLMQLFEHLIDRALRHRGPEDPRIRITAESREDDWQFEVWNNGPAVAAEFAEKIFQPFERLHGKERPGPGLAICRVIVERHGGTIWVDAPPDGGCAFRFTLPAE